MWPFSRKAKIEDTTLRINQSTKPGYIQRWVDHKIAEGVTRGGMIKFLRAIDIPLSYPIHVHKDMIEATDSLDQYMFELNSKGTRAESSNLEEAIGTYEANIADEFEGSHPYERLRIIYAKQERYTDAIRVCEAYQANSVPGRDDTKRRRFAEWTGKYRVKMGEG